MASEKKVARAIARLTQELGAAFARHEFWLAETTEKATQGYQKVVQRLAQDLEQAEAAARKRFSDDCDQVRSGKEALVAQAGLTEQEWDAEAWRSYSPAAGQPLPRYTRLGSLVSKQEYGNLTLPALLPLIGSRNVLIKAKGSGKEAARQAVQSLVLRLLAAMPPGKLRLVCIDPVGLGSTVAGFIKGLPDILTGGRAYHNTQDIEQSLYDLESHMAFVRQKYLGVSFPTIDKYNEEAGQVEEPYRLLILADFPARFSDAAAQRLVSIATNGPGTGVFLVMMADLDSDQYPRGFNLADIERTSSVVWVDAAGAKLVDRRFEACSLSLDAAPPADLFQSIVDKVKTAALSARDVRVPFSSLSPLDKDLWSKDSRYGVNTPIGQFGARDLQEFILDEKLLSSALVVGKTGSGKSTLLHILINGLAHSYSPEELHLYLLDFKQVEFKDYAIRRLPHARVVAVKSEREFGLSVLRGLDAELQNRKDLFGNLVSLSEYRNKTGKKLPRILLLADEFQELFSYDDSLSTEAALILDRLVRQGRAFGINVLLATQTLAGPNTLPSATKNQIPVRIALQCSDADSRLVLSEDNDQARLLERPGEAIYNASNGRPQGNNRFQIAWLSDQDRSAYLAKFRKLADQHSHITWAEPIIFDGDTPSQIQNNRQLVELIQAAGWPPIQRGHQATAWLGEPIEIRPHTGAVFRRQSRSNLLVVGQPKHEDDAVSVLLSTWLSLASQQPPAQAQFFLLNLLDVDSPLYELLQALCQAFPHTAHLFKKRGVEQAVQQVYQLVSQRAAEADDSRHQTVYLFIAGLHRSQELRQSNNDSYSTAWDKPDEPEQLPLPEQLARICRDGPDLGIHTIIWCDTLADFWRSLDRRGLNEFGMRVALPMSPSESMGLIETEAASKIDIHRAFFYDEERGQVEKFRPYRPPDAALIEAWGEKMRQRNELA